jgi:serine/threonine protein kinase
MDLIRKMLCLDQGQRWTARQLLSHPWITAGDEELMGRDITGSLTELKRYNARRKLKAAADAVIMANRIARLTGAIKAFQEEEESVQAVDEDIPAAQAMHSSTGLSTANA